MNALINAHTHRGRSRSPYVGLTSNVLPEAQRSHTGVSSDYVQKANHEWFVLRVTYNRTQKAHGIISTSDVQSYMPMHYVIKKEIGKKKRILQPLLPNLLFVYTTREAVKAHPINPGGRIFDSTENLYLCAMNNQGLLALAQLILPSEILTNFEVVRVEEEASLIRIYLDESVKAEYKENPEIESKGFCEAVTIRDFPIRDKGVDLIVRRRKWYDKQNNRYFSDSYELKAEGTRYSKEFAAFLKGVYGDDSYDLPFA